MKKLCKRCGGSRYLLRLREKQKIKNSFKKCTDCGGRGIRSERKKKKRPIKTIVVLGIVGDLTALTSDILRMAEEEAMQRVILNHHLREPFLLTDLFTPIRLNLVDTPSRNDILIIEEPPHLRMLPSFFAERLFEERNEDPIKARDRKSREQWLRLNQAKPPRPNLRLARPYRRAR